MRLPRRSAVPRKETEGWKRRLLARNTIRKQKKKRRRKKIRVDEDGMHRKERKPVSREKSALWYGVGRGGEGRP